MNEPLDLIEPFRTRASRLTIKIQQPQCRELINGTTVGLTLLDTWPENYVYIAHTHLLIGWLVLM